MNAAERLTQALANLAERNQRTPCLGSKRSARWTSDDLADLEWAAFHCVSLNCPLLDLCGDAADEMKARHFTWGGRVRSPQPRTKAS